MADNYLENKMEEHRRRGAAPQRHRAVSSSSLSLAPGEMIVKYPEMRVLVAGTDEATVARLTARLRAVDARTAFVIPDIKTGRSLAQLSGARHYPFAPEASSRALADLGKAWNGTDIFIFAGESLPADIPEDLYTILVTANDPAATHGYVTVITGTATAVDAVADAVMALVLTHPRKAVMTL